MLIEETVLTISIHASRVGGDQSYRCIQVLGNISIHASRVGGDAAGYPRDGRGRNFNPRLPGGRRPIVVLSIVLRKFISIHASRVGGDAPR